MNSEHDVKPNTTKRELRTTKRKRDDDSSVGNNSVASMTSQEFLDQHNDLCECCNLGGDLLCCATCNLVFHLKCTRPRLKEEPPGKINGYVVACFDNSSPSSCSDSTLDNWSCSYCVASGVTGYKKEARTRRRAQAAVRQMTRNKQGKGSTEDEDDKTDDEDFGDTDEKETDAKPSVAAKTTTKEGEKVNAKEDAEEEAADTEMDEKTSKEKPDKSDAEKGEKSSAEKTNEATTGKKTGKVSSDEPAAQPEAPVATTASLKLEEAQARRARHRKAAESDDEEDIWCNFCKDDSSIPICVFCACRVCFGKHDWVSEFVLIRHITREEST